MKNENICGGPLMPPINVNNQGLMILAGLHPPMVVINKEEFHKSEEEKLLLKKMKLECTNQISSGSLGKFKVYCSYTRKQRVINKKTGKVKYITHLMLNGQGIKKKQAARFE